jgi:hypothetical protein
MFLEILPISRDFLCGNNDKAGKTEEPFPFSLTIIIAKIGLLSSTQFSPGV